MFSPKKAPFVSSANKLHVIFFMTTVPAARIKTAGGALEGRKRQSLFQRTQSFWSSLDLDEKNNLSYSKLYRNTTNYCQHGHGPKMDFLSLFLCPLLLMQTPQSPSATILSTLNVVIRGLDTRTSPKLLGWHSDELEASGLPSELRGGLGLCVFSKLVLGGSVCAPRRL